MGMRWWYDNTDLDIGAKSGMVYQVGHAGIVFNFRDVEGIFPVLEWDTRSGQCQNLAPKSGKKAMWMILLVSQIYHQPDE